MTDATVTQEPSATAEPVAVQTDLTPHQKFLELLPEEYRSEPMFKNFNDVGSLAKSYINAQRLVGADKATLLRIPSGPDDKEAIKELHSKLGVPEDIKGYEIDKVIKEIGIDGVDDSKLEKIAQKALTAGVPKAALNEIVKTYLEDVKADMASFEEMKNTSLEKYDADLRKEWGDAYDTKAKKIQTVLQQTATEGFKKLAAENPHIFDHPDFVKTIDAMVKMREEDPGAKGGDASGDVPLTPAEARAEIAAIFGDKEKMKILLSDSDPRRAALLARKNMLHKYASASS